MDKKCRGTRGSEAQKEYLINYLERNIDFAKDRFDSADGARHRENVWNSLAVTLNRLGGASKDGRKWRKYWMDLRKGVREKHYALQQKRRSINASHSVKPLSSLEERIMKILTKESVDDGDAGTSFESDFVRNVWIDWKSYVKRKILANKRIMLDAEGGPCRLQRVSPLEERVADLAGLNNSSTRILKRFDYSEIFESEEQQDPLSTASSTSSRAASPAASPSAAESISFAPASPSIVEAKKRRLSECIEETPNSLRLEFEKQKLAIEKEKLKIKREKLELKKKEVEALGKIKNVLVDIKDVLLKKF